LHPPWAQTILRRGFVQTLVDLLVELKTLATATGDPNQLSRINHLFANKRAPAEFQVGRHFVAQLLVPQAEAALASFDPAQRLAAIETCRTVFPRAIASRLLRRVVKDPDPKVRSLAKRVVRALGLADVAPPDIRYRVEADSPLGRYNPTGWAFGIFPNDDHPQRKAKKATRKTALDTYQLPPLADAEAIATLLGVSPDTLSQLMRPGTEPGSGYVEFEIPKAKGGTRRIAAPRTPLRKVQRTILDQILAKVPVHDACHGFVPGRSTVSNAKPHVGRAVVIKIDLKDFFPTVHYRRVKGLFQYLGYGEPVAAILAGLTTYRPKLPNGHVVWPGLLPQGAPTSPAIANLISRRLDQRLSKLAAKYDATYTRYADDLTFSFATNPEVKLGRFLWWVDGICQQEGFTERPDKRRILRSKNQQRVTGLVVNRKVNLPRDDRRRFRAILHNCKTTGIAAQATRSGRGTDSDFKAYLAGYAAYIHMVDPVLGKAYLDEVAALLGESNG
jgi:RNA-directed DNA polymerase